MDSAVPVLPGATFFKFYLHTVENGGIMPLIYEGRFVDQKVDEANIDLWFEQTTKRLTDAQRQD